MQCQWGGWLCSQLSKLDARHVVRFGIVLKIHPSFAIRKIIEKRICACCAQTNTQVEEIDIVQESRRKATARMLALQRAESLTASARSRCGGARDGHNSCVCVCMTWYFFKLGVRSRCKGCQGGRDSSLHKLVNQCLF